MKRSKATSKLCNLTFVDESPQEQTGHCHHPPVAPGGQTISQSGMSDLLCRYKTNLVQDGSHSSSLEVERQVLPKAGSRHLTKQDEPYPQKALSACCKQTDREASCFKPALT